MPYISLVIPKKLENDVCSATIDTNAKRCVFRLDHNNSYDYTYIINEVRHENPSINFFGHTYRFMHKNMPSERNNIVGIDLNSEILSRKNLIYVVDLLSTPAQRAGIIGDIIEQYENVKKSQGEHRAEIWFRTQIMWTALNLLDQRVRSIPGIALALVAFNWVYSKLAGG